MARVSCPNCGSDFNLVDETLEYKGTHCRTIAHFEFIEELGRGAFGTVFKARDTLLDRTVAIKIPRQFALDTAETELFLREARAAARLTHPNIVSVHEVGRANGSVYIVSHFIDGMTLADWLTGQLPTAIEAAQLCAAVAKAVHYAHELGVVHRDLKPGNIILDRDGIPHVTDFGLARRETGEVTMTVEGKVIGTPAYMSPEQARGDSHYADRRSDVYSLGVILFELLTGEKPFRGNTRMMLHQVLNDDPPPPRSLNSHVPRDLETICLACLEKQPAKRYQSAQALANDLQAYLAGEPIKARRVTSLERGLKWVRRHPTAAGFLSASLIAIVASTALLVIIPLYQQLDREKALLEYARSAIEKQRDRAENSEYLLSIFRAYFFWQNGQTAAAREMLTSCPPKYRDWEFEYLYRLFYEDRDHVPAQRLLDKRNGKVAGIGFANNGAAISGSADGSISINVTEPQARTKELGRLRAGVSHLAVSSDGKLVAAVGTTTTDGVVRSELGIWSVMTGERYAFPTSVSLPLTSLAISRDTTRLAAVAEDSAFGGGRILVWTIHDAKEPCVVSAEGRSLHGVAFSPDGSLVASIARVETDPMDRVIVWNSTNGSKYNEFPIQPTENEPGVVIAKFDTVVKGNILIFSPDGKLVLVGSDSGIDVCDIARGSWAMKLATQSSPVRDLTFNPQGTRLASASDDGSIRFWDWKRYRNVTTSLPIQPRTSTDTFVGRSRPWEGIAAQPVLTLNVSAEAEPDAVTCLAFNHGGELLAGGTMKGMMWVWNGTPQRY